jgi:hypothetical protein
MPYTGARAWEAEGARIALISCLTCGAAIVLDRDDREDPIALHDQWHAAPPTPEDKPKPGEAKCPWCEAGWERSQQVVMGRLALWHVKEGAPMMHRLCLYQVSGVRATTEDAK